ncbi:MAG TPA: amidase family protein, partial [Vicinamibacterales bacterium]|nr:amidase family protein [Vicinamibacterales bacterium]
TVNFRPLRNNVAASDALIVNRLKEAGAVILGKTNVPTLLGDYQSFGPLYPTANNPHDLTCTPGGSTGGGAAAVAAGFTTLDIGSDLAGSIRVPARVLGAFVHMLESGGVKSEKRPFDDQWLNEAYAVWGLEENAETNSKRGARGGRRVLLQESRRARPLLDRTVRSRAPRPTPQEADTT